MTDKCTAVFDGKECRGAEAIARHQGFAMDNLCDRDHPDEMGCHRFISSEGEDVGGDVSALPTEVAPRLCPDAGRCHHRCECGCWRVGSCGPLSGVYPNNEWPASVLPVASAPTPAPNHKGEA